MIKSSKKKSKKDQITMQELQMVGNKDEYNKCTNNPVYFYNKYIRKEGQPILTQEEYTVLVKQWGETKHAISIKKRPRS